MFDEQKIGLSWTLLSLFTALTLQSLRTCNGQSSTTSWPLSATSVQLTGGVSADRDGIVQIYYQGQWGTICDDGWNVFDAAVVCRMLGFTGLARAVSGNSRLFTAAPTNLIVWWRAVRCNGNEANIAYCPFQPNNGACSHQQDAGVFCLGDPASSTVSSSTAKMSTTTLPPRICNTPSTSVRLMTSSDGPSAVGYAEGRVQMLHNGTWRGVCDDQWGVQDAQVICRMLCFNPVNARATLGGIYYGNATEGYWLTSVQCSGQESDVTNCTHSGWADRDVTACDSTEPAGVSCLPDSPVPPPLPAPTVGCNNEMITASFSRGADPLLMSQDLSVAGPSGQPAVNCGYKTSQDSNYVSITIPFIGLCNTTRQLNSSHVIYSNVVRYAVPSRSPIITRTEVYYVNVSCLLPRQADPFNDVLSEGRTPAPQRGNGLFDVQLILFTDNHFQTAVAGGTALRVVLGDWVYVGVQLYSTDPGLKLVLNQCYASPSADPSSQPIYSLIVNKCAAEPTLVMYPINSTLSAFRFQSFRFLASNDSLNVVYIHCRAYTCALSDKTGNCHPDCQQQQSPVARRRRRDISQTQITSSAIVVIDDNTIQTLTRNDIVFAAVTSGCRRMSSAVTVRILYFVAIVSTAVNIITERNIIGLSR